MILTRVDRSSSAFLFQFTFILIAFVPLLGKAAPSAQILYRMARRRHGNLFRRKSADPMERYEEHDVAYAGWERVFIAGGRGRTRLCDQ